MAVNEYCFVNATVSDYRTARRSFGSPEPDGRERLRRVILGQPEAANFGKGFGKPERRTNIAVADASRKLKSQE